MMLLMVADVISRFIFKSSILGAFELTENFLVIVVMLALAITQVEKRHIRVDVLTNIMPRRMRDAVDAICMIVAAVFIGVCTHAQYAQTFAVKESGIATTVLKIDLWPFNLCAAIGMTVFFIAICVTGINDIVDMFKSETKPAIAKEEAPTIGMN